MKQRKGFTTVELVIVIAVIAILATVLIPTFAGLIRKAHHNADVQMATNLTTQIKMYLVNNDIKTESDLRDAINENMGAGFYESLVPESAQYGYSFWYDIKEQTIVVGTIEEIDTTATERATIAFTDGKILLDAQARAASSTFDTASLRSGLIDGFFLMGRGSENNELASLIYRLENLTDAQGYLEAVQAVKAFADPSQYGENDPMLRAANNLVNKVATTVIVNEYGAFRYGVTNATPYVPVNVKVLDSTLIYIYNEQSENKVNESGIQPSSTCPITTEKFVLPAGVAVNRGGWPATNRNEADDGLLTGRSEIYVDVKNPADLKNIFATSSTDCVIVLPNNDRYIVSEHNIHKLPLDLEAPPIVDDLTDGFTGSAGGSGGSGGSNIAPITGFDITCLDAATQPGTSNLYYVSANKTVFVSYNRTEPFQLGLTNGLTANMVTWTSSDESLVSVNRGIVTIQKQIAVGEANTVTLTAKYGSLDPVSITVYLVRPTDVTFTLDSNNYSSTDKNIKITYNGSTSTFDITNVSITCQNVVTFQPPLTTEGIFSTTGNVFSLEGNTITLLKNSGTQSLTATISDHLTVEFTVTVEDNSGAAFDKNWIVDADKDKDVADKPTDIQIGDKYLFRIGNKNTFTLGNLFYNLGQPATNVAVKISTANMSVKVNGSTSASGIWTLTKDNWASATVQFTGTGKAEITVGNYINNEIKDSAILKIEVVNGKNVTSYTELTSASCVLLNDIEMSNGGSYAISNSTLYGNGFTFDVTNGATSGTGYVTGNYLISLNNAHLDNVKVVGKVYKSFSITTDSDYNRAIVIANGNSGIYNSYISNGMSPVRIVNGNLLIDNSTLKGGAYANLDIQGGHVTLKNVTTINQVNLNDKAEDDTTVVGLGIAVWYEGAHASTKITIDGALNQWNYISKSDANKYIQGDMGKGFVNAIFGSSLSKYHYNDGSTTWVNTGVVSMSSNVGANHMLNANGAVDTPSGYIHGSVSISLSWFGSASGYFWSVPTATVQANYNSTPTAWKPFDQYPIAPSYVFEYDANGNYDAKDNTEDNDYCYWSDNDDMVFISMDQGDTKNWNSSILEVTKNGQTLPYTVTMNGTDYTGKTITFNTAGVYNVVYTYTDTNNFNASGNTYPVTYTKKVTISVTVKAPDTKSAEFDFNGNGGQKVQVGNEIYVMPNVSGTSTTIGSKTINGVTVCFPIVEAYTSDGRYTHSSTQFWKMCFPVFKNVVTITDYANGGIGAAVTYDASTTTLPVGLSVDNPATTFQYGSKDTAPTEPGKQSNVLCYFSPTLSNNGRAEQNIDATYTYTDNAGNIYRYIVRYHVPETIEGSGGCVTPDTLVTLADGSKKEIQYVTYEDTLLVWNFYEGKYEVVPAAIIFNMGTDNFNVVSLIFEDGTIVKMISGHRFFDQEANKFVLVSETNVADYIGHSFAKVDGNGYKMVKLVDYTITNEYTTSYSIMSAFHYNFIVEDMFSDTFHKEDAPLFDYFEMGDDMMYDNAQMQADIEKYGLYTYEDFAEYLTYEQFVGINVQYLKIAVGKGQFTFEGILDLINTYLKG